MTATRAWRGLLWDVAARGQELRQEGRAHEPRDRTTLEVLGHQTTWDMRAPAVACPLRRVGYRFMAAEAAWVASGSNRLAEVAPYARYLESCSDDGRTLSGAYGPKFADQVGWVVGAVERDPRTRQAVAAFWRERPGPSRDVPCTVALQWLLRDGILSCVASMRSSDAWLGVPYDVSTFSALSAFVALSLRARQVEVTELGHLYLTAGSQHLYKIDWDAARRCAAASDLAFDQAPLDLGEFDGPDDLVQHLWSLARRDGTTRRRWLEETWLRTAPEKEDAR